MTGESYVAIADSRFGDGAYDDAVLFRTHDGVHWSRAINSDTAGDGVEHLTPEVAAHGGTVYLTWALTTDPDGTAVRQQVTASPDGGATFAPPADVGPRGDLRYAAVASGFGHYLGDVTGIVAVPGRAYLAWPLPTVPPGAGAEHQTLFAATVAQR